MTRISDDQAKHLKAVVKTTTRWKHQLDKAAGLRAELDQLVIHGHALGISTHRLAQATGLSQPRIFQIVEEHRLENAP